VNDLPPNLLGDYHLCWIGQASCAANSPAIDAGAASKATPAYQQPSATTAAPAFDIDNQGRPGGAGYDIGADEKPSLADLAITKTDGQTTVQVGSTVTYTIVLTNLGPSVVSGAQVTDSPPAVFSNVTWTCTATAGSSCVQGSGGYGSGDINLNKVTLNLLNGGSATFRMTGTLSFTASGTLDNTATVTSGATDPNLANNSATDSDTITVPALPTLLLLDNFNRANATNLGTSWSQPNNNIRLNSNQANENTGTTGFAYWNGTNPSFGSKQGAALAIANSTLNADSLILKASGGTAAAPLNYIRVQYQTTNNGQLVIATTTNSGGVFTSAGTLNNANSSFTNGDVLTAQVNATGLVSVWRTRGATTLFVGYVQLPNNALWTTGGGRIGMSLPNGARVDNFSGRNLP
jgi:uncharacterized repeat protein (TIGR01451 family)